jgi:hypothetical protein
VLPRCVLQSSPVASGYAAEFPAGDQIAHEVDKAFESEYDDARAARSNRALDGEPR